MRSTPGEVPTNVTDTVSIRNVNNNGGRYNPGNPRTAQLTTVFAF